MPSAKIDLSAQISKLLMEYGDDIRDVINTVMPEVADKTVQQLKATSPKRSGEYAKGWRAKPWAYNSNYRGVTIHNAVKPQITHLLEFGHAKRNGGRVAAEPHIKDAEDFAEKTLIEEVTGRISKL